MDPDSIVAAELGENGLKLFYHNGETDFRCETVPFAPWVLVRKENVPAELQRFSHKELAGSQVFNCRIDFPDTTVYTELLELLKKSPEVFLVRDLVQQALSRTALRLFRQMSFDRLRRMEFKFTADGQSGKLKALEIGDASGEKRFEVSENFSEKELLEVFNNCIKESDPDVICGFNCCRADLPLVEKRAGKLGVKFSCGRDGSGLVKRPGRFTVSDKPVSFNRYSLHGRHLLDMVHPVMLYDAAHRDFESMTLEYLKEYFSLSGSSTVTLLRELENILLPAYFYRCSELPFTFQDAILKGTGAALDAMLTAEYCQLEMSMPLPESAVRFTGALANAEKQGVFKNVRHCDIRSLYPSILLYLDQSPSRDEGGVFLKKLARLRQFRLRAKDRANSLPPGAEKEQFEALQSSYKILINSFYGYLGFSQGCFNDFELAAKVTAVGRELLGKLVDKLDSLGARVIEMDTDGIYFTMPENAVNSEFESAVRSVLYDGIEIEFDSSYRAMYSYKTKNYALLHEDGSISVAGAALKSRALEKFQRDLISAAIRSKLLDDPEILDGVYSDLKNSIAGRSISLADLAKSETLSDSPENYRRKHTSPSFRKSAAYELALASSADYRAGDTVRFYVTGTKASVAVAGNSKLLEDASPESRDENTAYYLKKLDELYQKFAG